MDAVQSIKPRSAVPPRNQALREAAAVPATGAESDAKRVDAPAAPAGREDRRSTAREFLIGTAGRRALLAASAAGGAAGGKGAEQALLRRRAYHSAPAGKLPTSTPASPDAEYEFHADIEA
ncbi:MAG TPA: hypothetical protein VNL39_07085 [Xanthobacteraceae bacterium]|nr:hypothetical protein [Xanthobacteraceae bacterium]